jgi:basic membrane protein A
VLAGLQGRAAGVTALGLKEGGLDLAMDAHNAALVTPAMKAKVEQARAAIVAGTLPVVDYTAANRCR